MTDRTDGDDGPMTVVIRLTARAGKTEAAEQALVKIADPTRANPDCLEFRILHSDEQPSSFLLVERWVSAEANAAHARQDYMADYMAAKDEIFADIDGEFMTELHSADGA